ncbi:PKD domain-containing protein [Deminuibacter soli]|uniref:PKD domain-containing protein n=1 Tax=Deminuibacter soli TaxID=2291815 RepID=A0A3E1NFX6_9BACT|nr:PKD domain-containing protein [Deminuibacter soli]RFM26782.1 PKD domain-containing protein [Deminuibacter soli]
MQKRLQIVLILLCACASLHAQNLSNRGTEFWVGYGHNEYMEKGENTQELVLYLSAEQAAEVTVTVNNTTWVKHYSVAANTVLVTDNMPKGTDVTGIDSRLYSLPTRSGGTSSEGVFPNQGIHIESNVPIVAYAHSIAEGSSGVAMLMPVETWGYTYYSVNSNQRGPEGAFSWTYVVASHDNTVVEITPASPTRNGLPAGVPFNVTLNRGEIYQMLADNAHDQEATGTRVRSIANPAGQCYPVGVFSGSSETTNPMTCGQGFTDADMQQLFPLQAWGKRYLTAPVVQANDPRQPVRNAYKILVNDPATVVKVNGVPLPAATLSNHYYYYESRTADLIEADQPIMIAQFMTGQFGTCDGPNNTINDPDMMYISPVDQGIKRIGFYRNNRHDIVVNYLTMIVPNGGTGLSSIRIDGQPLAGLSPAEYYSYPHPQLANYTVIERRWTGFAAYPAAAPGQCIVTCDSAFTATTCGLGDAESYSYNAGTHINNLHVNSMLHNTLDLVSKSNPFTCIRTPVKISALIAYQPTQIVWKLSALSDVLTPATDITDNAPAFTETVVVNGSLYYRYTLPADYVFSTADTYELPLTLTSPTIDKCDHTEDAKLVLEVRPKPLADFSVTHQPDCSLDALQVASITTTTDGYTLRSWDWIFPGGAAASGINATQVIPAGVDQLINLHTITNEGCVADTAKKITVYAPPVADFAITPPATPCENKAYTFTGSAAYQGSGTLQWYWDFGNGDVLPAAGNPQQKAYVKAGTYNVQLVVKASDICVSNAVTKPVTVFAAPQLNIAYSEGCLPKDGVVNFVNNTSISAGAIASHQWDFGDANATAANPNTSALQSPSHMYSLAGSYNVAYKAVSDKGCISDTVIKATFNPAPVFSFSALPAVCDNAVLVSVAKASVTNGVPGTGYYKGDGVAAAGSFIPGIAGAGMHTVTYVYSTSLGCTDSVKQTIEVYAAPVAAFLFTDNTCSNAAVNFTPTATTAAGDVISNWNWKFGDGTAKAFTAGDAFQYTYATDGSYPVNLTVTGTHCTSSVKTQTVTVQPLPVADFIVPDTICMPGGKAVFRNTSTIKSRGDLNYAWDFGDGTGSSVEANPAYAYAAKGVYTVQLTATSGYGCRNAVSKVADKFYDRPTAAFTVAPKELCQGNNTAFTDNSTGNSAITNWYWNFGDGSTNTLQTPDKIFRSAGSFDVSLVVKSADGCASAPASQTVTVHKQPVIDAGPSFTAKEGAQVQFNAVAASSAYALQWQPAAALSDATVLHPYLTVTDDVVYTLTATGEFNCTTSDSLTVTVLREVIPPNAFTPNGDGVHDVWEIANLSKYPKAVVDVFNRWGQHVYHSDRYGTPWNGRMNGNILPFGTYYYVINLGTGGKPLSGYVTILK